MRAMYPDAEGFVERGGVKVGYEVFGAGEAVILLFTSWAIVHARQWKAQVPYLARHFRVIAVEGRGNGRADRPADIDAYRDREYVDDAMAVLDTVGADRVVAVGLSLGGRHALQLAAWYPDDPVLADALLLCATEVTTDDDIARESRRPCGRAR